MKDCSLPRLDTVHALFKAAEETGGTIPRSEEFLQELGKVFKFSDFVAKSCIRDPQTLIHLIESGDLHRSCSVEYHRRRLEVELSSIDTEQELTTALRQIRRREMVRIAWRDLAGLATLDETTTDLSSFADACVEYALNFLYRHHCESHGIPTGRNGSHQHLVVLGMGKLGACELNFSSDIDLIFAYPEPGETQGGPRPRTNDEFFIRLSRALIKILGSLTADGIVFRVDMGLRPFGDNGPLVMHFDAMESYYQSQGREWERYAWIKARVIAGNKEAGNELLTRLRPFIYRRYLDFGVFEALRDMKRKITLEVQRKGMKNNIKLGPGGIREIEFFGQIFQLLRGGVVPVLQIRPIQEVISVLADEGYITHDVARNLKAAYIFLRNTEHRLQAWEDRQTHELPDNSAALERLAASMGFSDTDSFQATLSDHRQTVHNHFKGLLEAKEPEDPDRHLTGQLEGIWHGVIEDDQLRVAIDEAGFNPEDNVAGLLSSLREDPATRALGSEGRKRLDKLIPQLIRAAGTTEHPFLTLNRLVEFIKTIERRTCYLSLLLESPTAITHLVKLADASPWIVSFLTRYPLLLDELLDPRTLYKPPEQEELARDIRKRLSRIPDDDLEYQIQELCVFKQINTLRVAAADVTGTLPLMRVSDHLTYIAEKTLDEVLNLAWRTLVEKHGMPLCDTANGKCGNGFAVIAYGKLGGLELGYSSDLDMVFLHAGGPGQTQGGKRPISNSEFFSRLGQRILHYLSAHTPAGRLYEPDMRLRPSGISGLLVSQIEAFGEYQMNEAWTWEHQALLRARPVCGDPHITERFDEIRKEVLTRPRDRDRLREEVETMRLKLRQEHSSGDPEIFDIKQDPGGIVDIEFLVQYLVLLHAHTYPELIRWSDNIRQIETLLETGIIDEKAAHFLRSAYLAYRSDAHRFSLQEKPARVPGSRFQGYREKIQAIWSSFMKD